METKEFLDQLDEKKITAEIGEAEKRTSGEIRVFVSRHETGDPMAAAQKEFASLGMSKTAARNGVLIYFAPRSRNFAIIGDSGVHAKCGTHFWDGISKEMTARLQSSDYTGAICGAVRSAGELLAHHFPYTTGDSDELPNEVAHD